MSHCAAKTVKADKDLKQVQNGGGVNEALTHPDSKPPCFCLTQCWETPLPLPSNGIAQQDYFIGNLLPANAGAFRPWRGASPEQRGRAACGTWVPGPSSSPLWPIRLKQTDPSNRVLVCSAALLPLEVCSCNHVGASSQLGEGL